MIEDRDRTVPVVLSVNYHHNAEGLVVASPISTAVTHRDSLLTKIVKRMTNWQHNVPELANQELRARAGTDPNIGPSIEIFNPTRHHHTIVWVRKNLEEIIVLCINDDTARKIESSGSKFSPTLDDMDRLQETEGFEVFRAPTTHVKTVVAFIMNWLESQYT